MIIDSDKKLAGVLTDGDIRRTIIKHSDTSGLKVKDVMTLNPKILHLKLMLLLR